MVQRNRGAEKGQFQAHHGGFMDVADHDIFSGARREVFEKLGYDIPEYELEYLFSIGPGMYRSELTIENPDTITLHISDVEAEPAVGFVLPIFLADVGGKTPSSSTDGEVNVKKGRWMHLSQITAQFGRRSDLPHSAFNYFQIFVPCVLYLNNYFNRGDRVDSSTGEYTYWAGVR